MQDFSELKEKIVHELLDLAKQSTHLGVGLENVAPAGKLSGINYSVQYLLSVGESLAASRENILNTPAREWLLLLQQIVETDQKQREVHHVGKKFHFIHQRLQALCVLAEEVLAEFKDEKADKFQLANDERFVYIYLYNATGADLQTWRKMLNQAVFYEHSINRPIYTDESAVSDYLRSKSNPYQHAYITVAIKNGDVLPESELYHDVLGHPLFKVKEGALKMERFFSFTHNNHVYTINPAGQLIKKED